MYVCAHGTHAKWICCDVIKAWVHFRSARARVVVFFRRSSRQLHSTNHLCSSSTWNKTLAATSGSYAVIVFVCRTYTTPAQIPNDVQRSLEVVILYEFGDVRENASDVTFNRFYRITQKRCNHNSLKKGELSKELCWRTCRFGEPLT